MTDARDLMVRVPPHASVAFCVPALRRGSHAERGIVIACVDV